MFFGQSFEGDYPLISSKKKLGGKRYFILILQKRFL